MFNTNFFKILPFLFTTIFCVCLSPEKLTMSLEMQLYVSFETRNLEFNICGSVHHAL